MRESHMEVKIGRKTFEVPEGGALRWNVADGKEPIMSFHVEVKDGFFRVYVPSDELPSDIEYGAHEVHKVCDLCGK